ncbi:MAG TPA: FAD-dependent oxidoreductase [Candidatus Pelethocola excrementipullorum]|nr:FAD-dependent oxidoreductase [Candidatus Pelethocola excrementipullorum]
MSYELLKSPGQIGTMKLKNRTVFPAMGAGLWDLEKDPDCNRLAAYHARRAKAGCALNLIEITAVHLTSRSSGDPSLYSDEFIPAFKKMADAVHQAGGKLGVQLWHGGRQLFHRDFDGQIVAPSPIGCSEVVGEKPRALTTAECYEIIEAYGDAAVRAKEAGLDCVEIHGAHGYLIDQFLNEYTNKRTDEFGGSFENRCRFGVLVVENIRSKVGADYPVLMRVNAYERCLEPGGIEIEEAIEAAKKFVDAGIDCLDISQGSYDIEDIQVPPYYYPVKYNAENAAQFKKVFPEVPVLCAGRLITPELCEEVLQDGMCDFVGLGRVQLADPDFVTKVYENRPDEIIKCIGCEQGCVEHIFDPDMDGITCVFHPESGHELNYQMEPAREKKKFLVIGAGPAGLEVSRTLAQRGHQVTVFEKAPRFGGQIGIAAAAPGKELMLDNMYTMAHLAAKAGVEIRLNTEATKERIEALAPDHIIDAAGAHSLIPPIPGAEYAYDAWNVLAGQGIKEDFVVIIGGGLVGIEMMEILGEQGKKLMVVEMMDAVARDVAAYLAQHTRWQFDKYHVDVRTNTKCVAITEDSVTLEQDGIQNTIACKAVVFATGSRSNSDVEELVKSTGIPYSVIGDAKRTGKLMSAIAQGNELGRTL